MTRIKWKRIKYIIGLILGLIVICLFYYYMPEPIATVLTVVLLAIWYNHMCK